MSIYIYLTIYIYIIITSKFDLLDQVFDCVLSIGYTPRLRFLWDLLTERHSREVYKCHSNRNRSV